MILGACKIMNVFRIWEFSTKQYFSYLAVGNICRTPHSGTVFHHCNNIVQGRKIKEKGLKMYQQFNVINEHQANGNPCKLTMSNWHLYNVYLWILSWLCNVDNSLKLRPHSAHSYLKAQVINYSLRETLNAYFIHHYGFSSVW